MRSAKMMCRALRVWYILCILRLRIYHRLPGARRCPCKKMKPFRRIIAATALIALLGFAHNLIFITNWGLLLLFFYCCLPSSTADEACITHAVFAQTWAIAAGTTLVVFSDDTMVTRACLVTGCKAAWAAIILIHYLPPLILTRSILTTQPSHFLLDFRRSVLGLLYVIVIAVFYCTFMSPSVQYGEQVNILAVVSLTVFFSACSLAFLRWSLLQMHNDHRQLPLP